MRRSIALPIACVLLLSACSGSGPSANPSATGAVKIALNRDAKTLVVAVDAFNADFDPASAYLLSEALIWRGIYESLVRLKGSSASEVEPLLADTWEHTADDSSWTFHLHPGARSTCSSARSTSSGASSTSRRRRSSSWTRRRSDSTSDDRRPISTS